MSYTAVYWALFVSVAPVLRSDSESPAVYMNCARACADCQLQCDSCYKHCLGLVAGGAKQHARTERLVMEQKRGEDRRVERHHPEQDRGQA